MKFYKRRRIVSSPEISLFPCVLKYQRTEYAKKIRKQYEAGLIQERRCNMREYTLRTDGIANTLTTVSKDNYVCECEEEYERRE